MCGLVKDRVESRLTAAFRAASAILSVPIASEGIRKDSVSSVSSVFRRLTAGSSWRFWLAPEGSRWSCGSKVEWFKCGAGLKGTAVPMVDVLRSFQRRSIVRDKELRLDGG